MPRVQLNLGHRAAPDALADLLAACHDDIRQHLTLACRLASEAPTSDAVRALAAQVRRYFTEALPLHVADEERTISPLLVGTGDAVAAALRAMTVEHEDHQHAIDRLVALCTDLSHEPTALDTMRPELGQLVVMLAADLDEHLAIEERVVFPALRTLDRFERAYILTSMQVRREAAAPRL